MNTLFVTLGTLAAGYAAYAFQVAPADSRTVEWFGQVAAMGLAGVGAAGYGGYQMLPQLRTLLGQLPGRAATRDDTPKPSVWPASAGKVWLSEPNHVALRDTEILAELAERYAENADIVQATVTLQNKIFSHRMVGYAERVSNDAKPPQTKPLVAAAGPDTPARR